MARPLADACQSQSVSDGDEAVVDAIILEQEAGQFARRDGGFVDALGICDIPTSEHVVDRDDASGSKQLQAVLVVVEMY